MRISRLAAAIAAPMLIAGLIAPSYADDIFNNLDATIDSTAESMPLNVGGANGTTTLYVQPQGGDGKSGCNLTGSTTLTVSVSSSDPSVATVSPSSITFTECNDLTPPTVTVTPVGAGTTSVALAQVANTTPGTFNLAPATFSVTVAVPANTAPTIAVDGVDPGAVYNLDAVPTATCLVTDSEDGNSSFAATLSAITGSYASDGIGSQTASCSYTDGGGLNAVVSETYSIVPPPNTAPTVEVTGVTDGAEYELGSVPEAGCDATDTEDGNSSFAAELSDVTGPHANVGIGEQTATCSYTDNGNITGEDLLGDTASATYTIVPVPNTAPSVTVSGVTEGGSYDKGSVPTAMCDVVDVEDGNSSFPAQLSAITGPYASDDIGEQTASCSYTDEGNVIGEDLLTDEASVTYSIIDPTVPAIGYTLDPSGPIGENDWYRGDVAVDWTVTEDESPNSLETLGCADFDITSDQVATTYTCSASSAGGDNAVTTVSIRRDATAPSLDVSGGPADGASYYFGSVPVAPTCSADDNLSGVVAGGCTVTGWSSAVGSHTVNVSVKDSAGNTTSVSRSYDVLAWRLTGFYAPVDMNGVYNVVKGGSTVPMKFEVFADSELTSTAAVKSFTATKITCSGTALLDPVEITSTGGTSLRYDGTAGQFIQNWKTPTGAGICYSATMTTQDGSSITAYFKLK